MTIYTDDFNRSNQNLLNSSDWEQMGTADSSVEIENNQITAGASHYQFAQWAGDCSC